MTFSDLQAEFEKRGPWVTQFIVDGVAYGGYVEKMSDWRIDQFFSILPNPKRILELGSLEGGHTISLARHPGVEKVIALEGRDFSVERAKFAQQVYGVTNVDNYVANLETEDLTQYGPLDAIFCVGVLYHLPEPWKLVQNMADAADISFISTHYSADKDATVKLNGYMGRWYDEYGPAEPFSGMSPKSFWLQQDELKRLMRDCGYPHVKVMEDIPDHPNGPGMTFFASKKPLP